MLASPDAHNISHNETHRCNHIVLAGMNAKPLTGDERRYFLSEQLNYGPSTLGTASTMGIHIAEEHEHHHYA